MAHISPYCGFELNNHSLCESTLINKLQFRAVTIAPGSFEDEVRCQLIVTTIGNTKNLKWSALSYCWGTPLVPGELAPTILLNSQPYSIGRNLDSALRHIRDNDNPTTFFIDAICINQEDVSEKNFLVRYMWAIYQHASEVVVFLGPDGPEPKCTRKAFNRIREIGEWLEKSPSDLKNAPKPPEPEWEDLWYGIQDILGREWWTRVWVIQEVAVATSVKVMCGLQTPLPWSHFDAAISMRVGQLIEPSRFDPILAWPFSRKDLDHRTSQAGIQWHSASAIQTARRRYQKNHRPCSSTLSNSDQGLGAYLIRFRDFLCGDPRDKVYGIMQLSEQSKQIIPDYSKTNPAVEVYMQAVQSSVARGLAILSTLDYEEYLMKELIRPSWCPNLIAPAPNNYPFFHPDFAASGKSETDYDFRGYTMTLKGYEVDTISMIPELPPNSPSRFSNARHDLLRDLPQFFAERDSSTTPYGTHEGRSEALERTVHLLSEDYFRGWFEHLQTHARPYNSSSFFELNQNKPTYETHEHVVEQIYTENYIKALLQKPRSSRSSYALRDVLLPPHLHGRSIFLSQLGYVGLVPRVARAGDILVVFRGSRVPFCLRRTREGGTYHLIGDCYVDGIMKGELMTRFEKEERAQQLGEDFDQKLVRKAFDIV